MSGESRYNPGLFVGRPKWVSSMRLISSLVLALFVVGCESAPVSSSPRRSTDALVWHPTKERPQLLSDVAFSSEGDAETTARAFLKSRAAEFHLDGAGLELTLPTTRRGLAGTYLRFAQQQRVEHELLPVFGGEVIVLVEEQAAQRTVRAANLEHFEAASSVRVEGDVGQRAALEAALRSVRALSVDLTGEPSLTKGVHVAKKTDVARLAWRVHLPMDEASPPHDWVVFVDAATGAVLEQRDGLRFQAQVTGTAFVYDANPVASTGDLTLVDGNNAATPALDAARFLVPLPRLDGSGFTRGSYADVRTRDATARVVSMTNDFQFSRNTLGFEQANAYFHLDRAQARLQALGMLTVNNRPQGASVDAQNADNSFYSPNSQRLSFGVGGVDDAEDGDIVVHEYGHAIQDDQVPGFGGDDEGAMGEGFGDYLAASFALTLAPDAGHPQLGDPACVGDWDGTAYSMATPKCLRRVDERKHYPEDEAGEVHDDGEMWSAALWTLRSLLGADTTDRLVIESHFLLGTSSSFFTAAGALGAVDMRLNGGVNTTTIRRTMIAYGLSRTLSLPPPMGPVTSLPVSIGPARSATGTYLDDADDVQTLTVPGATGLILVFERLELETHNQCLNMSCDNVYLTNADGDLFQVLSGVQNASFSSTAIDGDTVNIRLVSDPSQNRFGYRVIRVDVLGTVADAGIVFDGGMDLFDGGTPPPVDAGVRDAGMPPPPLPDAGDPPVGDAGMAPPFPSDAGMMPTDAGFVSTLRLPKLGTESLSPAVNRGCGCGASSGAQWLAGLVLLALRRRRRTP